MTTSAVYTVVTSINGECLPSLTTVHLTTHGALQRISASLHSIIADFEGRPDYEQVSISSPFSDADVLISELANLDMATGTGFVVSYNDQYEFRVLSLGVGE